MQKWEYRHVFRQRTWKSDTDKGNDWHWEGDWQNYYMDGNLIPSPENGMVDISTRFGEEGWELVGIVPRSGVLGCTTKTYNEIKKPEAGGFLLGTILGSIEIDTKDYAGFTTEELWVFKRSKE